MPFRHQSRDRQGQVVAERGMRDLRDQGGPFVEAVDATRMPMVVTDPRVADNPIIYANKAFLGLCGYQLEEVLGQNYFFLLPDAAEPAMAERVEAAMTARRDINEEIQFHTKDGRTIWVAAFISPMSEDGVVVRHFASFLDVTERVESEAGLRDMKATLERRVEARTRRLREANARLQEEVERRQRAEENVRFRDFLIREVNHRTKNAFQLGISLLSVQARQVEDEACRAVLGNAMGRLQRMAEVHALLTYQGDAPDSIDFADYLRRLCHDMEASLAPSPGQVRIEVDADEDMVSGPDLVVPLGLIVGEVLTNAFKHAFPDGRRGRVSVRLRMNGGGRMRLSIEDDGIGLPPTRRAGSLGLRLVEMLARQIRATATVEPRHGGEGTLVVLTFSDPVATPGV
jgi:PAS domain S-box-containing protein